MMRSSADRSITVPADDAVQSVAALLAPMGRKGGEYVESAERARLSSAELFGRRLVCPCIVGVRYLPD